MRTEVALQAFGDEMPTSIAGAATMLIYTADVEADLFDNGSPLLRNVYSVARGLQQIARGAA